MSNTGWLTSFFGIVLFIHSANPVSADEVRIINGDRLTGEIIRMEKELLVFKTTYADEKLSIPWKEVGCIITIRSIPAVLKDNEFLIGKISCPENGKVQIESNMLGKSVPLPLTQLLAINPATYSGIFNLGGSLNGGNTETKALNVSTRFQVKTHKHRFTVDAKYNYGEVNGTESTRNSTGSLKYDFFAKEKVYTYAQSLSEQDSFANLNLRNTEGLGLGYQFFDSRQLNLFIESGISYFNEDLKVGEDRRDAAGRWASGLDWEAIPKRLKLYHRQEGYYNFSVGSVVLRAEQGFRIPLIDNVAANFEVDYRFNSSPQGGKKKSDLNLILGLTYEYAYW